jgi:hypothetical protein
VDGLYRRADRIKTINATPPARRTYTKLWGPHGATIANAAPSAIKPTVPVAAAIARRLR